MCKSSVRWVLKKVYVCSFKQNYFFLPLVSLGTPVLYNETFLQRKLCTKNFTDLFSLAIPSEQKLSSSDVSVWVSHE